MGTDPTSKQTKRERKGALRAEREAAAAAQASRKQRQTRLMQLGGVVAAALVVVVALVLISSSGGDDPVEKTEGESVAGQSLTKELFDGVPQDGAVLGKKDAPVTLVEYADLQCPFCKTFAEEVMPPIVQDYVRTGKVKMELRLLSFLGPDSITGGKVAYAAAEQDRMWDFVDLFYENQGQEGSGYVDDKFLDELGSGVRPEFDFAKAKKAADGQQPSLDKASNQAQEAGLSSTPSFQVGKTGGKLETLNFEELSTEAFTAELDKAVKAAGGSTR